MRRSLTQTMNTAGRSLAWARSARRPNRPQPPSGRLAAGRQEADAAPPPAGGGAWGSAWGRRPKSVFAKTVAKPAQAPGPATQPSQPPSQEAQQLQHAPDPALSASIRASVDVAAAALADVVEEVLNELLVEQAGAYVLGEHEDAARGDDLMQQAARGAVVKRLDSLDSNFLAALNAYLVAPSVARDPELTALLRTIRAAVLELVAARLPPAVQVLNAALAHSNRSERERVLQVALSGGQGAVPGVGLDSLGAAAAQLVDDMEDQQVVADRVLLARLVLLREELRLLAEQQAAAMAWGSQAGHAGQPELQPQPQPPGAGGPEARVFAFQRANLPARCAAFIKGLLAVQERPRRLGLISKAFAEDWMGEQPADSADPEPAGEQPQEAKPRRRGLKPLGQQLDAQPEGRDVVRPGRFFASLAAMTAQLEQQLGAQALDGSEAAATLALLQRLGDIRAESLVALDQQQRRGAVDGDYQLS